MEKKVDLKGFYKKYKNHIWIALLVFLAIYMKVMEESGRFSQRNQVEEDLYEVMGVSAKASLKDIKKQYNKLVIDFHPD